MSIARTLIVGIGSPHGDDQAGWLVAERLAGTLDRNHVAVRKAKSPAELLDWLDGTDRLIVCDACRGLGRIGEVRRWTWPDSRLAPRESSDTRAFRGAEVDMADAAWSGTHDLPLSAVLQLANRLGRLPQGVVIWSVEGADGGALSTMSSEVAAALPRLIADIVGEISQGTLCTNDHS